MPKTIVMLLLFLFQQNIFSQPSAKEPSLIIPDNLTGSTSGISSFIKEHFPADTACIRVIFVWVANNINYDIEKFQNKSAGIQPVADVLKTRLTVCRGYADLFNELCNQCNITSIVISGYTKQKGSNGIENDVIKERFDYLKNVIESYSSKNSYEQAMNLNKRSISLFNEYIAYKNKQFTPVVEDKDIKVMIDSISYHVNTSYTVLGTAVARDEAYRQAITKAFQELERFQNRVNQEKEFVTTYLNTNKTSRNQLFYKK